MTGTLELVFTINRCTNPRLLYSVDGSWCLLQANAIINDHAKRLKQAEHHAAELQKRCDELNSDLQNSNSENQRVLAELTRLKTTVNDQQSKIDSLTRDNNKLTGQTY